MNDNYNINNPRLTRGEYWLLESVVEFTISLNLLVHEHLGEALNKSPHGMDRDLLIKTLLKLQNNGLIEMSKRDEVSNKQNILILNRSEIIQALDETKTIGNITTTRYQLTKLGGQVWEAFAQPNWNIFIGEWSEVANIKPKQFIECADERLLNNYFHSRNDEYMIIDMETVNHTTLKPFKATYWKTLPIGYRIDFDYTDVEDREKNHKSYRHVMPFHMPYPKWYFWK